MHAQTTHTHTHTHTHLFLLESILYTLLTHSEREKEGNIQRPTYYHMIVFIDMKNKFPHNLNKKYKFKKTQETVTLISKPDQVITKKIVGQYSQHH